MYICATAGTTRTQRWHRRRIHPTLSFFFFHLDEAAVDLNDLFVAAPGRKQGIGEALLERARQFAVETNAQGLILETAEDNPTRKLYERLGWQRDATVHYFLDV